MLWLQGLHSVWQCARKGGRKRKVKIRWVNDVKMTQYWNGLLSRASFTRTGHDLETIPVMRGPLKLISPPITEESKMSPYMVHLSPSSSSGTRASVLVWGIMCTYQIKIPSYVCMWKISTQVCSRKTDHEVSIHSTSSYASCKWVWARKYSSHMFAVLYLTL